MRAKRVLHILSQRPGLTGSGTTLQALVRGAADAGWQQGVIIGAQNDDPRPTVADLPSDRIHPLVFPKGPLNFDLPGMSDVMPYRSTCFSAMTAEQLDAYRITWRTYVSQVFKATRPDVIHSHHVWLLSSLLKDIAPQVPVVTHCHGTGLRQLLLCPHLAEEVKSGCRRNDRFVVLHDDQQHELAQTLGISKDRIHVVGGGFRDDIFHIRDGRDQSIRPSLVYAGKLSDAKGVPWLLDTVGKLRVQIPDLVLHIAGGGEGVEADSIRAMMKSLAPTVIFHGQLDPSALADLMRACRIFVLPSFYEGLALVLVEAIACGCRVVCTELPGAVNHLAPVLRDVMELVPLPEMKTIDVPEESGLAEFTANLANAICSALEKERIENVDKLVSPFTWNEVFRKVERAWLDLVRS